jgi:hypothetical protein
MSWALANLARPLIRLLDVHRRLFADQGDHAADAFLGQSICRSLGNTIVLSLRTFPDRRYFLLGDGIGLSLELLFGQTG